MVTPYIKSGQIFLDPLKGDDNNFQSSGGYGYSQTAYDENFSQFGYDAALLNHQDHNVNTPIGQGTIYDSNSMTSFSRPADMVMLTEAASFDDAGFNFIYWGGDIFAFDTVEGPYCFNGCSDTNYGEWFTYPTGYGFNGMQTNLNEGSATGGVAFRRGGLTSGLTNVAFIDGHAKALTAGALAVGTTWTPTAGYGSVNLTNPDVYRWYQY